MDKEEKIRFIDEKKLEKTILKDEEASKKHSAANNAASNPVRGAFLKFIHIKNKFNINDL